MLPLPGSKGALDHEYMSVFYIGMRSDYIRGYPGLFIMKSKNIERLRSGAETAVHHSSKRVCR